MAKRLLLTAVLALVGCATSAPGAGADGLALTASAGGVSVGGSPYRYVALSPGRRDEVTVVARIERDGGKVDRWWSLRGGYYVPAVAYDRTGGGLSADGTTLVLTQLPRAYPPETSRFAVLRTDRRPRYPHGTGRMRLDAVTRLALPGYFTFDAISPDGSTIYLIHTFTPHGSLSGAYEVRALDTASSRLRPRPIVDPEEPDERMQGLPVTRAASPDGRWAYTLYDGNGGEPFLHALDTVLARAVCIDLPQLEGRRDVFGLGLGLADSGRELAVLSGGTSTRRPQERPQTQTLLRIDTRSFAVRKPAPAAAGSGGGGAPRLAIGALAAALALAAIWLLARRQRAPRQPLEQG